VLKLDGYWGTSAPRTVALLAILRACPDLEELVLRNIYDDDGEASATIDSALSLRSDELALANPAPTLAVRLPHLRRLVLCCAGAVRSRALLARLHTPALQVLELTCLDDISPLLGALYVRALTSLPLKRLRIESCYVTEPALVRLLERLQSLTALELVDMEDVSPMLFKVRFPPPPSLTEDS
jgi:hypothetical protein